MVEESLGLGCKIAKVITKNISTFKHHLYTSYGMSKKFYGGTKHELLRTGQGNAFSGSVCRDQSSLIFKFLENTHDGTLIVKPCSDEILQQIAIAFVDDTDFFTSGLESQSQMQQIMNGYTNLYQATGENYKRKKSSVTVGNGKQKAVVPNPLQTYVYIQT